MIKLAFSTAQRQILQGSRGVCNGCVMTTRKLSSKEQESLGNEKPGEQKTGWTTIYRFPYIGIISALNRTKWYQLGATLIGCPFAYALEMSGEVGSGTAVICAAVGLSATVATTAFSKLSAGTIGFFYLNKDDSTARFGYVDSNGRRQDVLTPVAQFQSTSENRFFIRIAVDGDHLKLFHSHGIISDVEKFNAIL